MCIRNLYNIFKKIDEIIEKNSSIRGIIIDKGTFGISLIYYAKISRIVCEKTKFTIGLFENEFFALNVTNKRMINVKRDTLIFMITLFVIILSLIVIAVKIYFTM